MFHGRGFYHKLWTVYCGLFGDSIGGMDGRRTFIFLGVSALLLAGACKNDEVTVDAGAALDVTTTDSGAPDVGGGNPDTTVQPDGGSKADSGVGPDSGAKPDSGAPDASCLKPGAVAGPTCKATADCHTARLQYCFLKCMGCGCICYDKHCYDLRQFNCK